MMSYDKEKIEYYKGEPSRIKSYLFNIGILVRTLASSNVTTLANYIPNLRLNEASAYIIGTSAGYKLNLSIANGSSHLESKMRPSPRRFKVNNAGGQYMGPTTALLPQEVNGLLFAPTLGAIISMNISESSPYTINCNPLYQP